MKNSIELRVVNNIRKIIIGKGLKQYVVAKRAGFEPVQFSDLLNGRKVIKAEHIPPIADALGVDANTLFSIGEKVS